VTGQALFIDDIVPQADELQVAFAGSPCANGRIVEVDVEEARVTEGVVAVLTAADIRGDELFGPIFKDEQFLAQERVDYVGQPLVVVAAISLDAARRGCDAVRILVEEEPPVLSIEEAIRQGAFLGPVRRIERGDFERAWREAEHRIEGEFSSGGQEHFYLESQAAIATPGEEGQIRVHSSTQNPTELQRVIAEVLGLGMHEVVCETKRMGGAFGGKETQAALPGLMVALVAQATGRSARIVYDKDLDMQVTGKRHPYRTSYAAAFDRDGRIDGLRLEFWSDGGCAADLSTAVMERTMLHADNAYYLPAVEISGRVCRTNFPPNTAFRGFGGPQAVVVIENVLEEVAIRLGKDAYDVRRVNCYDAPGCDVTPYGQVVEENRLPEIFDRLLESSDYRSRRCEIETINGESCTRLKGIAMTAVKFGISFTTRFLNQANALVNVYADGTVQVSTGATEMGQGVNIKIRQLVADAFGVGIESVLVMTTSTEKNNNTSPTAASASTDLNGTAAVRACAEIRERLARLAAGIFTDSEEELAASLERIRFADAWVFDEHRPNQRLSFAELADRAWRARVDLGARGFYATPGIDYDRETGQGTPFLYYTTGCAVTEVTIDRFTGDVALDRVDLLMDIGRSINPGVDMGQVIGGFVQGVGWATTEALSYDDSGALLSYSPTTYKIPGVRDVPRDFRIDFLAGATNERNIYSSKAVGEPPLLLGVSAWAAVKHALSSVVAGEIPQLRLPATNEEILMSITELVSRQPSSPADSSSAAVSSD
jgi:xanthine dehydrogenase large subunit